MEDHGEVRIGGPAEHKRYKGNKGAYYPATFNELYYWIFGVVELLIFIRFTFKLLGANPEAGIVDWIYSLTMLLMLPFELVFMPSVAEGVIFEWSALVAMVFYAIFFWLGWKLFKIFYPKTL